MRIAGRINVAERVRVLFGVLELGGHQAVRGDFRLRLICRRRNGIRNNTRGSNISP